MTTTNKFIDEAFNEISEAADERFRDEIRRVILAISQCQVRILEEQDKLDILRKRLKEMQHQPLDRAALLGEN